MERLIAELANQHFYASMDAVRSFFLPLIDNKADFGQPSAAVDIAEYGHEEITINVRGLMLRSRSWLTDEGYAVSTEQIIEEIQAALEQEKRVRLVIDSPGGLVSGTSNLADLIYENRDKIDAYGIGQVASAAMWIYSAAGKRYAEKTTVMGSIGVVTSVLDDEEYWKSYGIVWKEVVSENAKNKRPDVKTESGVAEVKRYLTSLESVFLDSVSRNLNISREDVISKFHQGGVITGMDAFDIDVINGLTTYGVAAMPTAPKADKLAEKSNQGEGTMPISQEEFDAVKSQLDDATASVKDLNGQVEALTARAESAEAALEKATSTVDAIPEIVAMAFKQGADMDTALEMVKTGNKGEAAIILVDAQASTGATATGADINEPNAVTEDAEEAEYAMALAKKFSPAKK